MNSVGLSWLDRSDILLLSMIGEFHLASNYKVALINTSDTFRVIYLPTIYKNKRVLI